MKRIVIVGHGVAGLTAGDTLRRLGFDGTITVIGAETHATYSRPALSKAALAPGEELDVNFLPDPTHGAVQYLGRTAVGLDATARRVRLDDGTTVDYDGLVIATGTHARRFTDSPGEYTLRSLDDAVALKSRLAEAPKVTVVGGGPLGMEIASGALGLGCEVTLVHPGTPMDVHIGPFLAELLTEAAVSHGLTLVDDFVDVVEDTGSGMRVHTRGGVDLDSDVVVSAAGDVPNDDWLADSGLLVDGRLVTDARCRVLGHDDVVAAGDVAWIGGTGGPKRTPVWTAAIEQAKTAAHALLHGDDAAELSFQNYFWTDQWGMNIKLSGPIPNDSEAPEIVKGSLAERSFVAHWPAQGAAASYNIRMPIPRLHKIARSETVGV
ncbi:FAD-dependent pyridine nucleotide-disulfide oxidoreductase [Corynebacterium maris DSM 45190]|uniref:FAD-dependent pyridine nucleotide-disulfide oxidoreductase n=1 Tax=Corynebacterium maris DSM 45190 TaxID=1224163 RepID=S5TGM7_9CORY|nr:FAD-dependent oxidoreductase [Corynebacterium maris]AGS34051.1 FAD-dependent pyridine nucleotide-disulfide oxidoreductase [Corynebacterium maris DSM 45190]